MRTHNGDTCAMRGGWPEDINGTCAFYLVCRNDGDSILCVDCGRAQEAFASPLCGGAHELARTICRRLSPAPRNLNGVKAEQMFCNRTAT